MNKPIRIIQRDANEDGYDRVLSFLRDQLVTGRLKTGDRLLPERDLASALGVSRPVIREALRALATLGARHDLFSRNPVGVATTLHKKSIRPSKERMPWF